MKETRDSSDLGKKILAAVFSVVVYYPDLGVTVSLFCSYGMLNCVSLFLQLKFNYTNG